jgi:hypothetical protein
LPHATSLLGAQQLSSGRQTWPLGQFAVLATPQLTVKLQLFVAWPHCCAPHAWATASGEQPQTLLMHSGPPSHSPQSIGLPQLSVVLPQRPLQ